MAQSIANCLARDYYFTTDLYPVFTNRTAMLRDFASVSGAEGFGKLLSSYIGRAAFSVSELGRPWLMMGNLNEPISAATVIARQMDIAGGVTAVGVRRFRVGTGPIPGSPRGTDIDAVLNCSDNKAALCEFKTSFANFSRKDVLHKLHNFKAYGDSKYGPGEYYIVFGSLDPDSMPASSSKAMFDYIRENNLVDSFKMLPAIQTLP